MYIIYHDLKIKDKIYSKKNDDNHLIRTYPFYTESTNGNILCVHINQIINIDTKL